jgi:hypothetical protein
MFDGAEDRVDALVRGVFAIYERGAPELRAMLNEGDVHPRLQDGADAFEATLGRLIDAAEIPGDRRRDPCSTSAPGTRRGARA